jgi:hypothetical protein
MTSTDASGTYRVKLRAAPTCGGPSDGGVSDGGCASPGAPLRMAVTPHATTIDVSFASADSGQPANRFDVRYRENAPISDADFLTALPASTPPPPPGAPGSTVNMTITGLRPEQKYSVAVRALSACDAPSPVSALMAVTGKQQFTVLHGCFVATAAYGTPLAREVDLLRRVRDRVLLPTPLGRVAVATYYALSPPLAGVIASDERLRAGARALIAPFARAASAIDRAGLGNGPRPAPLR